MTTHKIICSNANKLQQIPDKSVSLVVTSPPYPMVGMWDNLFIDWIGDDKLFSKEPLTSFNLMHDCLNQVWTECDRVLIDGGFICINIGDATRSLCDNFQLFPNHIKIVEWFIQHGFINLPDIIWHKPNNSPNSFMGSGMYPAGAYVTYEHEYILIFRKGGKRTFKGKEKEYRQKSAYFWEERNVWFSDIWNIRGTSQIINGDATRRRNASFPFEVAYRLINMYSIEGDTVIDPFNGLGTVSIACVASNRNSIGIDIDSSICQLATENILQSIPSISSIIDDRLSTHREFVKDNICNYFNEYHNFMVKTVQEKHIYIKKPASISTNQDCMYVRYQNPDVNKLF
jgi:DNA modification methylase